MVAFLPVKVFLSHRVFDQQEVLTHPSYIFKVFGLYKLTDVGEAKSLPTMMVAFLPAQVFLSHRVFD